MGQMNEFAASLLIVRQAANRRIMKQSYLENPLKPFFISSSILLILLGPATILAAFVMFT